MKAKIHLLTTHGYMACGRYYSHIAFESYDKRKVTCKVCRNTKEFKKRKRK